MSRQLNLRVDESFAAAVERLAKKLNRPMASVLESVGLPAIEAAEADLQFEAEALAAWEEYELTGTHVTSADIESLFADSLQKAQKVLDDRGEHEEGSHSNTAV